MYSPYHVGLAPFIFYQDIAVRSKNEIRKSFRNSSCIFEQIPQSRPNYGLYISILIICNGYMQV
jgi:hypothetical protein